MTIYQVDISLTHTVIRNTACLLWPCRGSITQQEVINGKYDLFIYMRYYLNYISFVFRNVHVPSDILTAYTHTHTHTVHIFSCTRNMSYLHPKQVWVRAYTQTCPTCSPVLYSMWNAGSCVFTSQNLWTTSTQLPAWGEKSSQDPPCVLLSSNIPCTATWLFFLQFILWLFGVQ